jgi:signal transduction histidine kinase
MPELEGQSIFGLLDQVYQTGESFYAYEQLVQIDHHNTGQIGQNYYNFIYQPLHSLSGQVEGIFVFAYQVTDLVEARKAVVTLNQELEVRVATRTQQLEAALQEKEWHRMQLLQQRGWLEYILGQVPASIATLAGPEHRYSFFNDHYQTFSANRTQIGLPVAEVFPEVVDQGFIGLLDQVYATGKSFVGKETPVLLYDLTSGKPELRYVDFIYQPLVDEQSQITGILVFVVDVSEKVEARQRVEESKQQALALAQERAAANQELAALNEELQAANEEILSTNEELGESNQQFLRTNIELERVNKDLDNFVYTASHDLRAPISNIEGLLKALEREIGKYQPQTDKVEHLYSMLNSSVNRFKQTIGDLTDVARISKESQEDVASISISEVLQEVILDLTSQIQEAQAELDVSIPDQQVHFSRKNLKSILYNLLSNAVKYRSLERAPFIRIMFRAEGGYIVLTVEDNGLGIDMSQKEKIFGLFKRLHAHVEGTGIGLYIVKRIVENAGGRIEVESQVGVGSTFKVFFKQWP